jgi:tetratricopeptide (TPR) repeat protein
MNRYFTIIIILLAAKAGAQSPALAVSDSLYAVGEYSQAIVQLHKIDVVTEVVHLKLAKTFQAYGNFNDAEKHYELVLKENPERILTTLDYAKLLLKTGKFKKADSLFSVLTNTYPKNANFLYLQGVAKEKQEDSTALEYFKEAIQLESTHQEALYKLGKNELQNGQYNMAINYSLIGLEHNPENSSLLSILAQGYSRQQKHKLAIPPFVKLLEMGQGNEFVHSRLAYSYYQQAEMENAIAQYKLALEFEDRNSDTHYNLGKIYAITGDLERSEIHLLMAVLIKKQSVDAEFLSLGLTYKLKKDHKKALEYFNKALEENPDNERALYERAVAADNYFKDLQTKIDHYQAYLNRYEKNGNKDMAYLAQTRLSDLKKEQHLAGE